MSATQIDTTPGPRAESFGEVAEIAPPASMGCWPFGTASAA